MKIVISSSWHVSICGQSTKLAKLQYWMSQQLIRWNQQTQNIRKRNVTSCILTTLSSEADQMQTCQTWSKPGYSEVEKLLLLQSTFRPFRSYLALYIQLRSTANWQIKYTRKILGIINDHIKTVKLWRVSHLDCLKITSVAEPSIEHRVYMHTWLAWVRVRL